MRGVGRTIVVAGIAFVMVAPARASAQEQCSCSAKDPAAAVELQITAAAPEDHSRIGPEQQTQVVDLRGEQTVLVGEAPQLLEGVDLAEVPVLLAVGKAAAEDECSGERPAAGSNLSLTGQAYLEDTGPVVWTGPCQGTLTVVAATPAGAEAADDSDEGTWEDGLVFSGAVLAALALLCLVLALTDGRDPLVDDPPTTDTDAPSDEPSTLP